MKKSSSLIHERLKLSALVPEIRQTVVKILDRPLSELEGHQAFKNDKKLLALWAASCAEHVLPIFEDTYTNDARPRKAIEVCRNWVSTGVFKMTMVRKASLDSHAAAREVGDRSAAGYAARSAGHAVATAHVATHSLGAAAYAIKAVVANSENLNSGLIEREWQNQKLLKHLKSGDT